MSCETAVNEALPVGGLFGVTAEQEDEFAAPAETSCANGERGGFVGAKAVEEVVDAGFSDGEAVAIEKGDEGGDRVR